MKLNDRSSLVLVLLVSMFVSAGVAGAQQSFPTQALTPSLDDIKNTAPFSGFGDAVAIEGRTLMVGIPLYMPQLDGPGNVGRVGIFTFDPRARAWTRTGSIDLSPEDASQGSLFGAAVALGGDQAAIGSLGAVRIYNRVGSEWKYATKISSGLPNVTIQPALAFQHHILAVSATEISLNPDGSQHVFGRIYIYRIDHQGQAQLLTRLPEKEAGGGLGGHLALDGDTLAVTGSPDTAHAPEASGAVFIYSGHGHRWVLRQTLLGSPSAGGYGNAVALKRRILVVGAPLEDFVPDGLSGILSEGAAYVYQLRHGKWVQTQKLEPAVDGHVGEEYAGFGWSAGLGGRFAAFGSPFPTDAFQTTLGQTQVYRWDGDQFVFSQEVSRASANALAMNAHHVVAGTDAFVHAPINYVTVIDLEPKASDPDTQEDDQLEDDE
jgi:hypothetical protein